MVINLSLMLIYLTLNAENKQNSSPRQLSNSQTTLRDFKTY